MRNRAAFARFRGLPLLCASASSTSRPDYLDRYAEWRGQQDQHHITPAFGSRDPAFLAIKPSKVTKQLALQVE